MSGRDLTRGNEAAATLSVAGPMVLGIAAVISVGIADAVFLGMLGQQELAVVGFVYPITVGITSLSIGLSAGVNAALSQAIGKGKSDAVVDCMTRHALIVGCSLGLIVALTLAAIHRPLFALMGASDALLDLISPYIIAWAVSYPFLVTMMSLNAMFRARGDGTTAATIMVIVAALNIAINPLLIFGWGPVPGFGTGGAGWATAIARIAVVFAALYYAHRIGRLSFAGDIWTGFRDTARKVLHVGLPASLSNAINPLGLAAVTAAVATLGEAAVAGFGAATRIQSICFVPLLALSAGIGPVVGQNWGAEKHARAGRAMSYTFAMCVAYGLGIALILIVFAGPLVGLIAATDEDREIAALYLRIAGGSFLGYGFVITANGALNARDKPAWAMGLSIGRVFLLYLPGAWLGVYALGFPGIAVAAAAANVGAAIAAVWIVRRNGLLELTRSPGGRGAPSPRPAE